MNVFKKMYARVFEGVFRIALPVLPYKDPTILDGIGKIPTILKEKGKKKPMIVTDRIIRELDFTKTLFSVLDESGVEYEIYGEVNPNPTTAEVEGAREEYIRGGCDCIIAIGGGSALDCAKALGARIVKPKQSLAKMKGILKVRKKIPLLIAIPTTAGTGSETTLAAVITDAETRHKYAINDFPLIPPYAVLDVKATASLPPHVAATTGIDALTHALEAYLGRSTTRSTRADALQAIKLIFENLPEAYRSGDEQARKNMLYASHLAGRAFSKSYVGYVHALAHALGGKYNTPHGLANAVLLTPVIEAYGGAVHKKLKQAAVYCGFVGEGYDAKVGAEIFMEKLKKLEEEVDIPAVLPEIRESDLDQLVNYAYREAYPLYPVPVLWDREQLKKMYYKVMKV